MSVDFTKFTNQKQWKAYIQNLLYTNNNALLKALVVLYNYQESDEKVYGVAIHENKVGFSKNDSEILTKIAEKFISGKKLTLNEFYIVQSRVPKYWRQIMHRIKNKIQIENAKNDYYVVENDGQLCYWWCKA